MQAATRSGGLRRLRFRSCGLEAHVPRPFPKAKKDLLELLLLPIYLFDEIVGMCDGGVDWGGRGWGRGMDFLERAVAIG